LIFITGPIATILVVLLWLLILTWAGKCSDDDELPDRNEDDIRRLIQREDRQIQNPLTLLIPVKPGRIWHCSLGIALKVGEFLVRHVYNDGSLHGSTSTHFARIHSIDAGKRLLIMVDHDGSFRHYLDDILTTSKNLIIPLWTHLCGGPGLGFLWKFPESLDRYFAENLRVFQEETLLWYSAYRTMTAREILNNREIRKGLFQSHDRRRLDRWIGRLSRAPGMESAACVARPMSSHPAPLPYDEIQGLVFTDFPSMPVVTYRFYRANAQDAVRARASLATIPVTYGSPREVGKQGFAIQLGLSHLGLTELGVPSCLLAGFSREFRDGMAVSTGEDREHHQRVLGDVGASDPRTWRWGHSRIHPVHVVVIVYAADKVTLSRALKDVDSNFTGWNMVTEIQSMNLREGKEHFGFRTNLSNPTILGTNAEVHDSGSVAPGEIVLGYPDASGSFRTGPEIEQAARDRLPRGHEVKRWIDLWGNGSYLVVRQLEQDVVGFWRAVEESTRGPASAVIATASRLVGRWPDGTPLVVSPAGPIRESPSNSFSYRDDPEGLLCPIGAHVRRANPRDGLSASPEESIRRVNRHRILRRSRPYGTPVDRFGYPGGIDVSEQPAGVPARAVSTGRRLGALDVVGLSVPGFDMGDMGSASVDRGLMFVCLNADLGQQFEFIQQSWLNNPRFGGLVDEVDSIAGRDVSAPPGQPRSFSIPDVPMPRRSRNLIDPVRTRGGEYFFLPGRRTLELLASLDQGSPGGDS